MILFDSVIGVYYTGCTIVIIRLLHTRGTDRVRVSQTLIYLKTNPQGEYAVEGQGASGCQNVSRGHDLSTNTDILNPPTYLYESLHEIRRDCRGVINITKYFTMTL